MPRKSLKFLLSEYIVNEYTRLEQQVKSAESEIRWGNYSAFDVSYLQLVRCKFDCFKEFANNVMVYCKISEDDIVDYAASELEKKRK